MRRKERHIRVLRQASIALLAAVAALLLAPSCRHRSAAWRQMDRAEAAMETEPDSAWKLLDRIDAQRLSGKEEHARYALLKSMALDKNYVDTTTFDVLRPAIDYYMKKGNARQRQATLFYQGRIYQNRNEKDSAMECYVRGLDLSKEAKDSLVDARLLEFQAEIFNDVYNFSGYVDNYLQAARIYKAKGMPLQEGKALLNALNGCILSENKVFADSIMDICESLHESNILDTDDYESSRLSHSLVFDTEEELEKTVSSIESHREALHEKTWLNVANAYLILKQPKKAKSILDSLVRSDGLQDSLKLHAIYVSVYEDLGDYENAFYQYGKCAEALSNKDIPLLQKGSLSSEINFRNILQAQKEDSKKTILVVIFLASTIILICLSCTVLFFYRSKRIEHQDLLIKEENQQLRINTLENELRHLKSMTREQGSHLPSLVMEPVTKRIEKLNYFFAKGLSSDQTVGDEFGSYVKSLISNRKQFMTDTRLAFRISNPDFIGFFEDKGLSEEEIEYVCLYALGLNGKEVGLYLQRPSHVNMSTAIRKKIGLDRHDPSLANFVHNLLREQSKQ